MRTMFAEREMDMLNRIKQEMHFVKHTNEGEDNIMLEMQRVGQKIAELRKASNMTQMELADKMNISFQAVSNWERGASMPDVFKLPELAKLFHVTIDELLGAKSDLIANAAADKMTDYLANNQVTPQELAQAAPVLKPAQVEAAVQKVPVMQLKDLEDILPYVSKNMANELAKAAQNQGQFGYLEDIAPYISGEVLGEIVLTMIDNEEAIGCLADLMPYMGKEVAGQTVKRAAEAGIRMDLEDIAPYVSGEVLGEIIQIKVNQGQSISGLGDLLACVGKDTADSIIRSLLGNRG